MIKTKHIPYPIAYGLFPENEGVYDNVLLGSVRLPKLSELPSYCQKGKKTSISYDISPEVLWKGYDEEGYNRVPVRECYDYLRLSSSTGGEIAEVRFSGQVTKNLPALHPDYQIEYCAPFTKLY